jgi:hypothetical protein
MISIGATANAQSTKNYDATAFSNWNVGLKDQYQWGLKDPSPDSEENTGGNNNYSPLTKAEVDTLWEHFKTSDKETFISKRRSLSRNILSKRFGYELTGRRNIISSPYSGQKYNSVLWSEYIDEIIEWKLNFQQVKQ